MFANWALKTLGKTQWYKAEYSSFLEYIKPLNLTGHKGPCALIVKYKHK